MQRGREGYLEPMGFELVVAVKRDPLDRNGANAKNSPYTAVVLNGPLATTDVSHVLASIDAAFDGTCESVIVDLESIEAGDEPLTVLSDGVMSIRGKGNHVQVCARDRALHARLAAMPGARDFLMTFSDRSTLGPRRALHLDGPHDR